jgi:hypothetical protein
MSNWINSTTIGNISLEIDELKARIFALETQLKEDLLDPIRTFEVVLRVTTRASTWGDREVDYCEVYDHFHQYTNDMKNAIFLNDEGDSIKVEKVTEVE